MNRFICRLLQVTVLLCFYIIPYVFLAESRGFELFTTWIVLTLIAGASSLAELWRKR